MRNLYNMEKAGNEKPHNKLVQSFEDYFQLVFIKGLKSWTTNNCGRITIGATIREREKKGIHDFKYPYG